VLQSPGDRDRGPKVLHQSFVRVDGRGQKRHDIRETDEETSQEMSTQVGEVSDVRVSRGRIGGVAKEGILSVGVHERDVHMPAVSRQALSGFGHETRRDAVFDSERFDDVSMRIQVVSHDDAAER
jgi:hypothetical protein